METKYYILLEIIICIAISFFLVYYYTRKGTNILALITAGVTWSLNFILIIFIPFDIYNTYLEKDNRQDEDLNRILIIGYYITYWSLFFCSWIFVPLMQEYEDSGDFTKKKKFIRSIKNNAIYYSILGAICIVFLLIVFLITKENFIDFLFSIVNFSLFVGLLLFYFLFGYSIISLPLKAFYKTKYEYQIKFLEWRAIDLKHNLEKIQKELVDDGYLLQSTLDHFQIMKRVNKSKQFEDEEEEKNKSKEENKEREQPFSSSELIDYSKVITERYDYLYDNAEVFGIKLKRNTVDNDKEPLNSVEELIKLNRKINKNEWDDLRIQIKIRNQYKHWLTLSTVLNEMKIDDKNLEVSTTSINEEGLIENSEKDSMVSNEKPKAESFKPLKNMSNFKLFYYKNLRRPLLYIYVVFLVFAGLLTLISQIGSIFNFSLYGLIVRKSLESNLGILGLHFFIMIPIIFLFVMSIYTFFKLKITGYFYMYKNQQTDSVSLMYFSTNLCRISFSICLDVILNIDDQLELKKITQMQHFLDIHIEDEEDINKPNNRFLRIYRYLPLIFAIYVLILIFKIPQKIAKLCGKKIFEAESNELMEEIVEGHEYYMELNRKYDGELIPKEKLVLPEDKYNK